MRCSIRSWIFPGSMLGSLCPKLLNSRLRVCCKVLRRHLTRQREKKACVYALCEVTLGCGATPCYSNGYCSIWYPMLCAIHCVAESSLDVVGAAKCCVSKYGTVVPAFLRTTSKVSSASFFNFPLDNETGTVAWGLAWPLSTGFAGFSTMKSN